MPSRGGTARLWDAGRGRGLVALRHGAMVGEVAFPAARRIAVALTYWSLGGAWISTSP
jgi:hypothetical protein